MRACPTQAIRVKDGKAKVLPDLCIDCGLCLKACQSGAIQATTRSFAEIDKFRYKVAVPSPVLFGQFPISISPAHIVAGLKDLGFDAVWDFTVELALVNRAIRDYVEKWDGPHPLLSVSCPVIVRLVQVSYPAMIDQLVRIQTPRELAGRELKRRYSDELGIDPDEIAAIYITPCQAKTISILKPAEGAKSNLEGALGISDVYNDMLAVTHSLEDEETNVPSKSLVCSAEMLRWSSLISGLPDSDPELEAEVQKRYPNEDFSLKGQVRPRTAEKIVGSLKERVKRIKAEEVVIKALPGLDCGLCGAPTCKTFAKDVAEGNARQKECFFLSGECAKQLRKTYLRKKKKRSEGES